MPTPFDRCWILAEIWAAKIEPDSGRNLIEIQLDSESDRTVAAIPPNFGHNPSVVRADSGPLATAIVSDSSHNPSEIWLRLNDTNIS